MLRVPVATAWLLALCGGAGAQTSGESPVLGRGSVLEERGDFARAKEVYLDGLRSFPRSGEISFRIGTLCLREGDWPQAIEYLRKSSALRPRDVDTLYYLAQAYYLDDQHEPARQAILRAVTLAPGRADAAQKLGEYQCEDNLCTEGLRHLLKARSLDPALPNIDFDLGMAYHKLAHVPEARRYLEAAYKKDPGNLVAARFLADVLGRQNEWEKARGLYEVVLAAEPRNSWALYGLGRSLIALGDYEGALRPLREAIAVEPAIAEAHFQLGTALRQLGRREEASRELSLFKALRDRTQGVAPPVSSQRTGAERRVWEVCERLLAENKESEALAYLDSLSRDKAIPSQYLIGVFFFNQGRLSDAVRLLARAAEIAPADADVRAFLGRAQLAIGDAPAAQETLARAQAIAPNDELPLVGLGELEYAKGNWNEAIGFLERSKTTQVPVLLKLCRLYFGVGNRAKALETAELVRAFGTGDAVSLRELDSVLAAHQGPEDAAIPRP